MEAIAAIIPVTVFAAIVLFLMKEILELVKKYRADRRKMKALRTIFARECELNHWTIKRVRDIVNTIRDETARNNKTRFYTVFSKSGDVFFCYARPGTDYHGGSSLAESHRDVMMKYALDVATLEGHLFLLLEKAIEAANELEYLRRSIIAFLDPDNTQDRKYFFDGFIEYALDELDGIYKDISALYVECTGCSLERHRVR